MSGFLRVYSVNNKFTIHISYLSISECIYMYIHTHKNIETVCRNIYIYIYYRCDFIRYLICVILIIPQCYEP